MAAWSRSGERRTVGTLSPQTPHEVNWRGLSPESRERLGHIGMRLSAGYTTAEVAAMVEAERDQIEHLTLPRRGLPVTSHWVAKELRDLRDELLDVS